MKGMIILLVVFVSIFGLPPAAADPCVFSSSPSGDVLYTQQQVMACFTSIPFNSTVRDQTLDVLTRAYQLFTFLDIASNPPDPLHFHPPVDLMAIFRYARQLSFADDFAFHNFLRAAFIQLHDAHTMYYAPECYASFNFYQPFNLVSFLAAPNASLPSVAVSPYFDSGVYAYFTAQGLDLDSLVGAQVIAIDGVDAASYVKRFADTEVGSSKDPSVRYNIAFGIPGPYGALFYPGGQGAWLGLFTQRESHFLPPPTAASVSYKLLLTDGSVVSASYPWMARTSVNYTSTTAFMAQYYNKYASLSPIVGPSGTSGAAAAAARDETKTQSSVIYVKPTVSPASKRATKITPIAQSPTGGAGAYQLGSRTLVLYLNTFAPSDYFQFASVILDGVLYARMNKLDQLLIDLTGNGGGDICLGRSTLHFLFPAQSDWGPTDMPGSPLADNLTLTSINHTILNTEWSPSFYQNEDDIQYRQNDPSWLIPGIPHVRGGLPRNYSQLIHISAISENCGESPFIDPSPFEPSKMLIMSYGFCGSTCALFADHAHNYEGVKTVSVGGFDQSKQQQYSSFPGLEVLETPSFYWTLNRLLQKSGDLNCASCTSPRNLLTTAGYRMCIREIYGPDLEMPLEYTWQPADFRHPLSSETAVHHELLWPEMLQYFGKSN